MTIQKLVQIATSSERYSSEYKSAWRQLFKLAKYHSKKLKHRDIDPATIVDDWVADYYQDTPHCDPADDQVANDMSCMQALSLKQQEYVKDLMQELKLAYDYRDRAYAEGDAYDRLTKHIKKLQKLIVQEQNTNLRSVPYELFEELGNNAGYDEPISETEQQIRLQEYRETFNQEPECDPDDSHYIERDSQGKPTITRLSYSYGKRRPRGNIGLLNGLYEQTDPEPAYQTPERRRVALKGLKNSTNADDIRLLFSLTQPTRRKETDEQWAVKVNRRRKAMQQVITDAQYKERIQYEKHLIQA